MLLYKYSYNCKYSYLRKTHIRILTIISTHISVRSQKFYDCITTHIIVSTLKYKQTYKCMYPCFIFV